MRPWDGGRARLRSVGLVALVLVLHAGPVATGEEEPGVDPASAALEREIAALESELESIAGEENVVTREIESLAAREALGRRRLEQARVERDRVEVRIRELEVRQGEIQEALEASRAGVRSALREMYKQSSMAGYASLLAISDPADLMRGMQHLDALARRQRGAIRRFSTLQAEATAAGVELRDRRGALDRLLERAKQEERAHAQDRRRRQEFLRRLQDDRAMRLRAAEELKRAAADLANALASFPLSADPPAISIDFERLKGALPWPADGRIALGFGRVRHPRFGTVTPHPGLDLELGSGAEVRAVAAGRVVFSRRYGGYGRTVVIDHGARYLSVYAHLAAATVNEGETVAPGQKVGFVAEGDQGGKSKLYFEIRHEAKALDPAPWLRRARRRENRLSAAQEEP